MLHDDEVRVSEAQLHLLIADQFPQWEHLPLKKLGRAGTDHTLFKLGTDLVARLPKIHWATGQGHSDAKWLPLLAPHLPLQVPQTVALGEPGHGYPFAWSVTNWIEGKAPTLENVNPYLAAQHLGEFVSALRDIDVVGGPVKTGTDRGGSLVARDELTREAIRQLGNRVDREQVLRAWEQALSAEPWRGEPAWFHGDLEPGNILSSGQRLKAVIDFGALGVGDPAVDLLCAWSLFSGPSRFVFREACCVDDDTWERGKGWALTTALIALPYYWDTFPGLVESSLRKIEQVLESD